MSEVTKFTCPLCKQEFFQLDFYGGFAADSCKCGNLTITLKEFESSVTYKHYIAIGYEKEKPTFESTRHDIDQ